MQLATHFLLACAKVHVHPPTPFPLINYLHNPMKDEKPDQHLLIPFLIGARQGFLLGLWLVSGLCSILLHLKVLGLTLIFWLGTVRVLVNVTKQMKSFTWMDKPGHRLSLVGAATTIIFVVTEVLKVLSWQTCVCCDKTRLLSRQKYAYCDKTFVVTYF